MSPNSRDIAARLVRCRGWAWMPGLATLFQGKKHRVVDVDATGDYVCIVKVESGEPFWLTPSVSRLIPDLDDAVTRAGILLIWRNATTCLPSAGFVGALLDNGSTYSESAMLNLLTAWEAAS